MTHGGNIYEIEKRTGIAKDSILDYSSNINPLGVPDGLKKIICDGIDDLTKYPDINYHELKDSIAQYYRLSVEDILVGNGAAQIIFDFINAVAPRNTLIVQPTFSEYERALNIGGKNIIHYFLREEDSFQLNVDNLLKYLAADKSIDMVIICNPNNPTGRLISKGEMMCIIDFCEENNIFLIIDEAFMDFADEMGIHTLMNECKKYKNLMVVRAFTKFYGIPGLRLGFGVTSNLDIKNRIELLSLPWNINTFASYFGRILLSEDKYVANSFKWLKNERVNFFNKLNEIKVLKVFSSETNFVLLKLLENNYTAKTLQANLLKRGILIRDCSSFKGLNEKYIRLAVKDGASNERLIKELKSIIKEKNTWINKC
ncbi:threonine-phosphate decarboxylase CobD [Alkaliphilus peptidifermentans]|uniref:threonine-phosphate decarboxylase n=1 Tax=Alkaliphilus peptidifermentans DSM 18978 TaxID=1120976 RepID=A0A1G5K1V4_9FIRM|nr:threonine-phosphate decarboxylase CobD [Alkaliphilus peptidifermentans]SCY94625.1 L-threonine O-3-phosphate decarboxylase [Alkaliphilus peptidifermentans DSM 18978]